MDSKETAYELIKLIKFKTGLNQKKIAERMGYTQTYLSEVLKEPTDKFIAALKREFGPEIGIVVKTKDDSQLYKDVMQLKAIAKTTLDEVAELSAKITGKTKAEVSQELNQKTMKNLLDQIGESK